MATTTKINDFVEDLLSGLHDFENDTISIALSNTAPGLESFDPTADGNGVLANVTQIAYTNYSDDATVDRVLDNVQVTISSGTATLDADDVVITASGGALATFQYIYIFNDTPTVPADPLVLVIDHGSAISLADGETATLQFNASGIATLV